MFAIIPVIHLADGRHRHSQTEGALLPHSIHGAGSPHTGHSPLFDILAAVARLPLA